MCSIHIDESVTGVNYCAAVTFLCIFSEKLNHLYAQCTMHDSQNDTLKWARRSRRDTGYCDGVAHSGL
jgi:hypothetical protein